MTTLERLREEALALREDERRWLAAVLADSLPPPDEGLDEYWREEIRRRLDELDRGEADLMDWEDAEALIFGPDDD
jgi:putative addiction module component (TIGR02574 family)